jgi:hypothetical protein
VEIEIDTTRCLSLKPVFCLRPVCQYVSVKCVTTGKPPLAYTFVLEEGGEGDDEGDGDHHQPEHQDTTSLWALKPSARE